MVWNFGLEYRRPCQPMSSSGQRLPRAGWQFRSFSPPSWPGEKRQARCVHRWSGMTPCKNDLAQRTATSLDRRAVRPALTPPAILAQQILDHLENPVPPASGRFRRRSHLAALEVSEVGLAVRAFNHVDVELDVRGQFRIKGVEQVAAKLLAAWAGQPSAAPDAPQRVKLEVLAVAADILKPGAKIGRVAEGLFHPRQVFGRQAVRQVIAEHLIIDRWKCRLLCPRVLMIIVLRLLRLPLGIALHPESISCQLVEAQACTAGHLLEPGDSLELAAGHGLLGDIQEPGDILIGPALDDQQLQAADAVVIFPRQPFANELAHGFAEQLLLGLAALSAAGDARRGPRAAGHLIEWTAVVVGAELVDGPPALLAQVIGQLVSSDREEIGLHVSLLVVVGQAGQEPDERFLDHVLAGRSIAEPTIDKRQQPPLEPLDELPPGLGIADTHLPDQKSVGVGRGHR